MLFSVHAVISDVFCLMEQIFLARSFLTVIYLSHELIREPLSGWDRCRDDCWYPPQETNLRKLDRDNEFLSLQGRSVLRRSLRIFVCDVILGIMNLRRMAALMIETRSARYFREDTLSRSPCGLPGGHKWVILILKRFLGAIPQSHETQFHRKSFLQKR